MVTTRQRAVFTKESCKCNHPETVFRNGYKVCKDCGLVLEKSHFTETSYIPREESAHTRTGHYKQATALNTSDVCLKGTEIKGKDLITLKSNKQRFQRLKKIQQQDKRHPYLQRLLIKLRRITRRLNLPYLILNEAKHRFKKLYLYDRVEIRNNVVCLAFCLWDAIRFHKYNITLDQLFDAFQKDGSRINGKLLVNCGALYSEVLKKFTIRKSEPKHARDYIPQIMAKLYENKELVKIRLKKKHLGDLYTPNQFLLDIEKIAYKVIKLLDTRLTYMGLNPYSTAAVIIYTTSRIIGYLRDHSVCVFTQSILTEITSIGSYTIRDTYIRLVKPLEDKIIERLKQYRDQEGRL